MCKNMVVIFIAMYCINVATSRVLNISNESTPKPTETRRITNGRVVQSHKRFMVYLLKAKNDPNKSAAWLCGGAIISHLYIITSAACVHTVEKIYVVNGYNKYVNQDKAEKDQCIMKKRKRIIYSCFSKEFNVKYMYDEKYYWNYGDIAVSRVEDPFDFYDMSYYQYCTYPPGPIRVETDFNGLEEHEVLTYGWGSRKYYRPFNMTMDLNEEYLRYSNGKTISIETCYNTYLSWKTNHLIHHARRFFICVTKKGSLDEYGYIEDSDFSIKDGCDPEEAKRRNANGTENQKCLENRAMRSKIKDRSFLMLGGFCQNDHGGPLVAYFGGHEVMIGISTLFWVSMDMQCRGPYMYTNLKCISKKISCILDAHNFHHGESRRDGWSKCDGITENEGLAERNITWPEEMP